ncbi:MAG: hypothetical protein KJ667_09180 [Alphaproteobacteria bacterium]|nr:hypothetical protein [Alphaproteobacteria bacterium]
MDERYLIPGERLLPLPSILKKLATLDQDAPEKIMTRAEAVAEQRRAAERAQAQETGNRLRAFLSGFFNMMALRREPLRTASAVEAINQTWAATGNDLRTAIKAHMQENRITAEMLGLSVAERESLQPLAVARPGYRIH